jgi:branched-chain amino acid transport system substrate-binding protein
VVGLCAQNDADGVAWAQGAGKALAARGYTMIDLGRFPEGTNDYTTQISGWKKEKVEILFSNMAPPDYAALWRQCFQAGFVPKVSTAGRAGLFSAAMEAIGQDLGLGVSSELMFHPEYGYKSSLSGETGAQICDAYEKASGKQWNQPIGGCYAGYEIVADALKRAGSLDKEAIRKALAATQLETLQGPTKFGPNNVAVTPSGCVQWVKGDKFRFRAAMVANGNYKNLPVKEKLISIPEIRQKAK